METTAVLFSASSPIFCVNYAYRHNLKLNYKKSCEIPFVRPRCNRHIDVPPPAVKGVDRVQHITALGVTLSHNFSMTKHNDTVMAGYARTLYGLRTLRAHGMPQACLQIVFRSTALAKFKKRYFAVSGLYSLKTVV